MDKDFDKEVALREWTLFSVGLEGSLALGLIPRPLAGLLM
jgi:hypothetical protein